MLSQTINDFDDGTKAYFNEIGKYKPLSKKEERALLVAYKENGDEAAKLKILQANMKFVISVAKEYRGQGLAMSDLIGEGNFGMVKALEKFDISQDVKFISYAVWWIRHEILSAIDKHNNLPAEELPKDFEPQKDADGDIMDEQDPEVNETYIDSEHQDYAQTTDFKSLIAELSTNLSEREQIVVTEYYGLNGVKPKTLEEIGKSLGLTKERVRQINEKSLKKMRAMALNKSITKDIYR